MDALADFDQQLYYLAPSGVGLILVGLANILFARLPGYIRAILSGGIVAGIFLFMSTLEMRVAGYGYAAGLFALGFVGVALLRSPWFGRFASHCRKPALAWCVLITLGMGTTIGALIRHEQAFDSALEREMNEFETISHVPDRRFVEDAYVTTDRGNAVAVAVARSPRAQEDLAVMEQSCAATIRWNEHTIRTQPADENTNCHGWVFTGGRYMIGSGEVDTILNDNGYAVVDYPEPGDIVVYRDREAVTHTAVVRYVAPNRAIMVEGKWGWLGVYLHAVDKSCYGVDYRFYRTERGSDLLRGISSPATPVAAAAEPTKPTTDN